VRCSAPDKQTRYFFGGDEHLFAEIDEEMSLEAFFKSFAMTNAVRESRIKGVTEICPANASFLVKFDPDVIAPDDLLAELKALKARAAKAEAVLKTRVIEVPVFYNDPWTRETLMRFRERHQDPTSTDLEYGARNTSPARTAPHSAVSSAAASSPRTRARVLIAAPLPRQASCHKTAWVAACRRRSLPSISSTTLSVYPLARMRSRFHAQRPWPWSAASSPSSARAVRN
jgi:hypothetical protein